MCFLGRWPFNSSQKTYALSFALFCIIWSLGTVMDSWTAPPLHPGRRPQRFHLQWAGPVLVSLGPSGCVLPETGRQPLGWSRQRREEKRETACRYPAAFPLTHTPLTHTHTRPLHSGSDAGESGCGNTRRCFILLNLNMMRRFKCHRFWSWRGRLEVILWPFVSGCLWINQNALLRRWLQSRCACTQPHFFLYRKENFKKRNLISLPQIFTMWSQKVIRNEECECESLKRKMRVNVWISFDGFQVRVPRCVWVSQTGTQNQLKIPVMQHSVPCAEG